MKHRNGHVAPRISQDAPLWRARFVALIEDLFREEGYPAPSFPYEFNEPLAVEMEIDGLAVALAHRPAERPHEVLMLCSAQLAMDEQAPDTLARLLADSGGGSRETGLIGVDPDTHQLVLAADVRIEGLDPKGIVTRVTDMVARVRTLMRRIAAESAAGSAPARNLPVPQARVDAGSKDEAALFAAVMQDVRRRLGIDAGPQRTGGIEASLEIERKDMRFTLRHGDQGDKGRIRLECRFGALSQDAGALRLELLELLHLNRALGELGASAAFTFDPERGEPVFWRTLDLKTVTGGEVVLTMDQLAEEIHLWRTTLNSGGPSVPGLCSSADFPVLMA